MKLLLFLHSCHRVPHFSVRLHLCVSITRATARHPVRGSRGDSTHDSRYKRVEGVKILRAVRQFLRCRVCFFRTRNTAGGKIGTAERFMSRCVPQFVFAISNSLG
jgi:hypothetical protein